VTVHGLWYRRPLWLFVPHTKNVATPLLLRCLIHKLSGNDVLRLIVTHQISFCKMLPTFCPLDTKLQRLHSLKISLKITWLYFLPPAAWPHTQQRMKRVSAWEADVRSAGREIFRPWVLISILERSRNVSTLIYSVSILPLSLKIYFRIIVPSSPRSSVGLFLFKVSVWTCV